METAIHPTLPLLIGGTSLLLLGLLPLLEVSYMVQQAPFSEKMHILSQLTPLDTIAIIFSAFLASLGGALLALFWVQLPIESVVKTAKILAIALAIAALVDALLLTYIASHRGSDTPWKAKTFADHERLFEYQINDVFCHAKGLQLCEVGSVAEGRQIFPLQSWPVDTDRAPGRWIATSCEGFKDSLELWDYQNKMELCRLCNNITTEEMQCR